MGNQSDGSVATVDALPGTLAARKWLHVVLAYFSGLAKPEVDPGSDWQIRACPCFAARETSSG